MYYILEKELKKNKITREELAKELDIGITTISIKLNGKSEFTLSECLKTKEVLNFKGSLDELFKTD